MQITILIIAYAIALNLFYIWYMSKQKKPILESTLDSMLLYLLCVFLIPYIIYYSNWLINDFSIELLRRATRNVGPLAFFTLDYYASENIKIKNLHYISIIPSIIILPYLTIGFVNGLSFEQYTGFRWDYHALTHWSLAFILATMLSHRKVGNSISSLNFGFQSIMAAGWLYEILRGHNVEMFYSKGYPTIIMPQILSIIILCWILYKHKFKPNKTFAATTTIFLAFSLFYTSKLFWKIPLPYRSILTRIPATAMILSTLTGIEGTKT